MTQPRERAHESPLGVWEVMSRREILAAPPWLRVSAEEVRLPSGRVLRDFYEVELPDFVVVVAETPAGEIVVEHQYKHGVKRMATFLPAGLVEKQEEPLAAAQRELQEETGYVASEWLGLGTFVVDGNRGCGRAHVFLARGARKTGEPVPDENEPLIVRLARPEELLREVLAGELVGLAHMAAFMLALGAGYLGGKIALRP